jgi:hypothetical protein
VSAVAGCQVVLAGRGALAVAALAVTAAAVGAEGLRAGRCDPVADAVPTLFVGHEAAARHDGAAAAVADGRGNRDVLSPWAVFGETRRDFGSVRPGQGAGGRPPTVAAPGAHRPARGNAAPPRRGPPAAAMREVDCLGLTQ